MSFEPIASDFYGFQHSLSDQEKAYLLRLRAFLEEEVRPIADEYWEKAEFPHHLVKKLADLDVFRVVHDETSPFPTSEVFRGWLALEIARVDASIGTFIGVHSGLAMTSIVVGGSDEQRAEWLPKMASGEVVGAFGLTEPQSGSDTAQGMQTTATRDGDSWTLNGQKRWIGNATWSDFVIIWAKDTADNQVKGFIVPTSTPGYRAEKIEAKQSLRTVQNADITLENVVVDESMRLQNINSFRDTAKILKITRAGVSWSAIGNSIGAWEAALAYAKERKQFGKPIAAHQLVQDLLVKGLGNITASIALVTKGAELAQVGHQRDEHAALAKTFTTTRMRETVAWSREILGGNGIVLDYGVARHFADAEAMYSYEGTSQINTLLVGKAITGESAFV